MRCMSQDKGLYFMPVFVSMCESVCGIGGFLSGKDSKRQREHSILFSEHNSFTWECNTHATFPVVTSLENRTMKSNRT